MKESLQGLATSAVANTRRRAGKRWAIGAIGAALVLLVGGLAAFSAASGHSDRATLSSYLAGLAAQGRLSGTVLVAKHGKVILDQGYGYANTATHTPNGPQTEYGLADATTTAMLTAATLQVTQANVYDSLHNLRSGFCSPSLQIFVADKCPARWQKIRIGQLVDGTSRLPDYRWGRKGESLAQTESACMRMPLERASYPRIHYTSCANIVMAVLDPGVVTAVPAGSWMPTGLIPSGKGTGSLRGRPALVARVPQLARQLFDGLPSSHLALDYDPSGKHPNEEYNDYFAAYSSAGNLYTYDHLLFSHTYMPSSLTREEITPRGIPAPPDPGISHTQWADGWKTGHLLGSRVVYTAGRLYNYQTANLRFPRSDVTVIVMTNTAATDALNTAEHAAAFVLPGKEARWAATGPVTAADLVGTYRRAQRPQDASSVAYATGAHYTAGLYNPFVGRTAANVLALKIDRHYFTLGVREQYTATNRGRLELFGQPPGIHGAHFCTNQKTDLTPVGYYRWSLLGRDLTITRVLDQSCPDRAQLVPGTWVRVGGTGM